jgi:hypothetical protein
MEYAVKMVDLEIPAIMVVQVNVMDQHNGYIAIKVKTAQAQQ